MTPAPQVPEQSHEPELLGHGIVDLVLWVPVIHLLSLGQWRLLKQLDHLYRSGICGAHNLPKDLGTQPGHAYGVAGQNSHEH